ncbi:MAG: ribosomal L7Ae/L30e/S12e/Gadd45 family protein [archaeon]
MTKDQKTEDIYEAIEKARSSGKIKKGTNETTKVVEKGIAKLVIVAEDVNPKEITMHLGPLCKEKGVACVTVPSKAELGVSAGLPVATVCVAIVQEGDAKELIKRITSQ